MIRVMKALSEGDLTQTIDKSYEGAFADLKEYANGTVLKLSAIIGEVNSAADALAGAAEQVSSTSQSLSQAASEQASGVEETSASIEQMTASIAQNTDNAKVTDSMATQAAVEATEGARLLKSTVAAMKQIAKKIVIIDDIAYQTNLLALNAAIEAARAGEHGKGFRGLSRRKCATSAERSQGRRAGDQHGCQRQRGVGGAGRRVAGADGSEHQEDFRSGTGDLGGFPGTVFGSWTDQRHGHTTESNHAAERLRLGRAGGHGGGDERPG